MIGHRKMALWNALDLFVEEMQKDNKYGGYLW